jgi:hypothetical protein
MNINGAKAAIKAFDHAMRKKTVPDGELMERYRVCKGCPKRRKISGFTSRVSRLLGNIANQHKVPHEFSKYKCGVCNCSFMLLLPALKEDLHKDSPQEAARRPDHCWVKPKPLTPPTS